jgi:hypothetical protein
MGPKTLGALLCVVIIALVAAGCRKDSAATAPQLRREAPSEANAGAKPHAAREAVTVRIRKLGGADGKQLVNQISVTTPLDDDFTVTEQVGATQLELRGRVTALDAAGGKFRVRYNYSETSADGQKRLQSTVDMIAGAEEKIGGLAAEQGMETLLLMLTRARPLNLQNDTLRSPLPSGGCDLKPVAPRPVCRARRREGGEIPPRTRRCDGRLWSGSIARATVADARTIARWEG